MTAWNVGRRPGGDRAVGSWVLASVAALLVVAFVVAPFLLAGRGVVGEASLSRWAGDDFVAFWRAGDDAFPAGMADLVDYWTRFHLVKAVAAGVLMIVLAVLARRMWTSLVDDTLPARHRHLAGAAGTASATAGLVAALLLMANVQGAMAPLSSALSLVPTAADDSAVAQVREQVARQLQAGDTSRPALARMVGDFGTYHAVLAVCAVLVACAAVLLAVSVGRSFIANERSDRLGRRAKALTTAVFALVAVSVFVLAAANISNAVDPASGLLLFYAG